MHAYQWGVDMDWMVLPVAGQNRLCRVLGGRIEPVGDVPGAEDARYYLDASAGRLAIMDSARKRVGLFAVQEGEPNISRVLPFATLPKDCQGHVAMAFDGGVLVGGHSKSGEAIWWRHPTHAKDAWQAIALPEQMRRPGKAIDGFHVDGDLLVAVDDIIVPRWLILYRIEPGHALRLEKSVSLPPHITYERIFDSFLGEDVLWLASRGINHGRIGTFIWGVDRKTFRERGCWSAFSVPRGSVGDSAPSLLNAKRVVEWQGRLLVPCGESGLLQILLRKKRTNYHIDEPVRIDGIGLQSVDAVTLPHHGVNDGVIAVGVNGDGVTTCDWIPAAALLK